MNNLISKIKKSKKIYLSTHRQSDGDGIGSQIALYYALNKSGIQAEILNVDEPPHKYHFVTKNHIQVFDPQKTKIQKCDLVLIFDTNDSRLLSPLYQEFSHASQEIIFIDHHPVLEKGPQPTKGSFINTKAASTGEICYELIKKLEIKLDHDIAQALYMSLVFDTQIFRFVRGSANSHLMAADLLQFDVHPEEIHLKLFGNYTLNKMEFLAFALNRTEYLSGGQLALLKLQEQDLKRFNMDAEESRDIIDLLMNIDSLQAAAFIREDGPQQFKLSFRSKGHFEVLKLAESLGGGGHLYSAGAYLKGSYEEIRLQIIKSLEASLHEYIDSQKIQSSNGSHESKK